MIRLSTFIAFMKTPAFGDGSMKSSPIGTNAALETRSDEACSSYPLCGWLLTFIIIPSFFVSVNIADADIYKYVDEMGVTHLTNTPTSSKYKVLIRTKTSPYRERRYDPIINELCKKYGVETSFIKAMVKTESDFDPHAVSKKGAKGLMQLMPSKASDLSVKNSFDPWQNLEGGIRHVRDLLVKYDGNVRLTLAAYNAGETAVEKNRGVPPFKETRDYISKVLRFQEKYR